ncbi:MAG: NUDIX hydrolase [Acidimicrobiales bacterium]
MSADDQDFDPATVPVRPAATVMLVDDIPVEGVHRLHVLMLARTTRMVFGPGHWVFPGGRVDPTDHLDDFDRICRGLTDEEASAMLEVDKGGLAWWLAACRETLEEAGLLLAAGDRPDLDLVAMRNRVREDEDAFIDLLLEHDIALRMDGIVEVARFITPMGSPRRFDARFFLSRAPHDQVAEHDDAEIVDLEWVEPSVALERWRDGTMTMMSPTVRMLACLARFPTAGEALGLGAERRPYARVRVADPHGRYDVLLPGEPGYETADLEVESGWIRLWPDPAG